MTDEQTLQIPPHRASNNNRRSEPRYAPRSKVKVECRKGVMDLGANVATGLCDLSQLGAKITTKVELEPGQEVSIRLVASVAQRPVLALAEVVRVEPIADDCYRLGVRFQKPLSYADLRLLTNF